MVRLDEARESVADTREKVERQNQQLSHYEAEVNLLRQRSDSWDSERQKHKRRIDELQDALNRARVVSNRATLTCLFSDIAFTVVCAPSPVVYF